jgi:hypothetical protein
MYSDILEHPFRNLDKKDKLQVAKSFKRVVGSITLLFDPVSAAALAELLSLRKETIAATLQHLHSILDVPDCQGPPIRLLHPSFRDFLLDKQRCCNQHFWVDQEEAHKALADDCLRFMSRNLRRDMCDLRMPGALVSEVSRSRLEQCLPTHLRYTCRYWVQHLQRGKALLYDDGQEHMFLRKHLLHWLEVLSLVGKTPDSVQMVIDLNSMVVSSLQNY